MEPGAPNGNVALPCAPTRRQVAKQEFLPSRVQGLRAPYTCSNLVAATCSARSMALVAVEYLRKGQTACKADEQGSIGAGNIGWYNFGSGNIGDKNIGNKNFGNRNIGSRNQGDFNICNDLQGHKRQCKLSAISTSDTMVMKMPPSPRPRTSPPTPYKNHSPPPSPTALLSIDYADCVTKTPATVSCTVSVTTARVLSLLEQPRPGPTSSQALLSP
ncbi:hypothetical protein ACKKBG_A02335 [Auxenochlorella protothecoides x Auxenochlorella symbiontica]